MATIKFYYLLRSNRKAVTTNSVIRLHGAAVLTRTLHSKVALLQLWAAVRPLGLQRPILTRAEVTNAILRVQVYLPTFPYFLVTLGTH